MKEYVIESPEQLDRIEPEATLQIRNLNLDGRFIRADGVTLVNCTGSDVGLTARWVTAFGGDFTSIKAAVTEGADLVSTSIGRITMPSELKSVLVERCNILTMDLGSVNSLRVAKSWIGRLVSDRIDFARLLESYIGMATSVDHPPAIYARDTAINCSNWPFVDGGPDSRGYRINVFRGRKCSEGPVAVTHFTETPRSEPALVVTAGCRTFVSFEDAVRHWQARRNGMLPLVRKAVELLKQKGEPRGTRDL